MTIVTQQSEWTSYIKGAPRQGFQIRRSIFLLRRFDYTARFRGMAWV